MHAAHDRSSLLDTLGISNAELEQNFQMNRKAIDEICDLVEDKMRPIGCR